MPPPIAQQGTRGGLITAMVIFAILFLTAAIFAIYFNANMRASQLKYGEMEKKYKEVILDGSLSPESEINTAVKAMKENEPAFQDNSIKWADILYLRGNRLAKMITGGDSAGLTAESLAQARIVAVNQMLNAAKVTGVKIGPDNLLASLEALTQQVINRERSLAEKSAALKKDLDANTALVKASETSVVEMQKAIEALKTDAEKARADAASDRAAKGAQIEQMTIDVKKQTDDLNAAIGAKQVEVTAAQTKITDLEKQLANIKVRLNERRVSTSGATIKRADGIISRISETPNTVWINLGSGDQISNGMTFEVYDKIDGVPALGEGMRDEDMPVGKGSIEIIRVGATTSECRVVKTTPGMTITMGDPIANLVYDANVKFNFVVYGKFDLDRNKVATDTDADVIKRLVTQWGGQVTDKINIDTDFVVLGSEPTLPPFTADDLNQPENVKKLADAQAEAEAYQKVKGDAKDLHIPIMNQNRFLYFVGYYDQAKR